MLDVVRRYTRAWRLLLKDDEDRLATSPVHPIAPSGELTLKDARAAIGHLRTSLASRGESSDLFGREGGGQLHGILGAIEQLRERCVPQLFFVVPTHGRCCWTPVILSSGCRIVSSRHCAIAFVRALRTFVTRDLWTISVDRQILRSLLLSRVQSMAVSP